MISSRDRVQSRGRERLRKALQAQNTNWDVAVVDKLALESHEHATTSYCAQREKLVSVKPLNLNCATRFPFFSFSLIHHSFS